MKALSYLAATWPQNSAGTAGNVSAVTTLVNGGVSQGDYCEYNLASHVGDDPEAVRTNREKLVEELQLPAEPVWLEQVHSNIVVRADEYSGSVEHVSAVKADASITSQKGVVCAVLTADCLPVFFRNDDGSEVAVAHAGWRGLHAGIISNTVRAMSSPAAGILVSLGPAIGPQAFEVGEEVFQAFVSKDGANESAFTATRENHYLCDIYQLARIELLAVGVTNISGGEYCTFTEPHRFYSYRRQNRTGRMASLIWLK